MQSDEGTELTIGSALFDMHYWGANNKLLIGHPYKILTQIRTTMQGGSALLDAHLKRYNPQDYYSNKILTVIEIDRHCKNVAIVTAAWAFDDRSFGLMQIEVDPSQTL